MRPEGRAIGAALALIEPAMGDVAACFFPHPSALACGDHLGARPSPRLCRAQIGAALACARRLGEREPRTMSWLSLERPLSALRER